MKKVDFYFDFLSPYSYFAWINHCNLDMEFSYMPVPMGSLFSHWDMKGPGEILPKRIYMLKSCFRYAAKKNISFIPPKSHPFNPLYALRLSTLAINSGNQKKMIDILFKAVWEKGQDVSDLDFLLELLSDNGFSNAQELLDKTFEKEVKMEVKRNLKEAKGSMIFGVPTFKVDDEIFWGNDSMEQLQSYVNNTEKDWDKELFKSRLGLS